MEIKQVIIVRADLKMPRGKIGSQCSHASMKSLLVGAEISGSKLTIAIDSPTREWLTNVFTKIVLKVNSEEELDAIIVKCAETGVKCVSIIDNGKTCFDNVPTKTCIAIGPDYVDVIDQITGHLELYK